MCHSERVDTSGSGLAFLLCLVALVAASVQSVAPLLEGQVSLRHVPALGWVVWLCVAVPSLLQVPFPQVYDVLYRQADAVSEQHEWWRLGTALTVQDGGIVGTVSNLLLLGLALVLALPLWGTWATVVTFVIAGIGLNLLAVGFGAVDGGGNSGATLVLWRACRPSPSPCCRLPIGGVRSWAAWSWPLPPWCW